MSPHEATSLFAAAQHPKSFMALDGVDHAKAPSKATVVSPP